MDTPTLSILISTAAFIGVVHTLTGPDHYVPFIAMARIGNWSALRTTLITLACGIGHVAGSIVLGALGIGLGLAVGGLELLEGIRGDLAAWLLLGFGLAYMAWGIRRAVRNRPHRHLHGHEGGVAHAHDHVHHGNHLHVHAGREENSWARMTPWMLFSIFVLGPCEPLIPILMYPAAEGSWWGVAVVTAVFGAFTLVTMTAVVLIGYFGLSRWAMGRAERYSHALAGFALFACGLAIMLGL